MYSNTLAIHKSRSVCMGIIPLQIRIRLSTTNSSTAIFLKSATQLWQLEILIGFIEFIKIHIESVSTPIVVLVQYTDESRHLFLFAMCREPDETECLEDFYYSDFPFPPAKSIVTEWTEKKKTKWKEC